MLTQGAIDECSLGGSDNSGIISIGCFNARSLCNKTAGVLELLKQNDISICCITETWLKSDDRAKFSEIHDMGFDVISAPRKEEVEGLVFCLIPKCYHRFVMMFRGTLHLKLLSVSLKVLTKIFDFVLCIGIPKQRTIMKKQRYPSSWLTLKNT